MDDSEARYKGDVQALFVTVEAPTVPGVKVSGKTLTREDLNGHPMLYKFPSRSFRMPLS
jgi:hypothetical protein